MSALWDQFWHLALATPVPAWPAAYLVRTPGELHAAAEQARSHTAPDDDWAAEDLAAAMGGLG